jgi:hypothetical protein
MMRGRLEKKRRERETSEKGENEMVKSCWMEGIREKNNVRCTGAFRLSVCLFGCWGEY